MGLPFIGKLFPSPNCRWVPCFHFSGRVYLNLTILPSFQLFSVCQVNHPGKMQCSLAKPANLSSPFRLKKQRSVCRRGTVCPVQRFLIEGIRSQVMLQGLFPSLLLRPTLLDCFHGQVKHRQSWGSLCGWRAGMCGAAGGWEQRPQLFF